MFQEWPKIPRYVNEVFHITEKIDGTNAAVIIKELDIEDTTTPIANLNGYGIWAQSRTRLIFPGNDNFSFASWVKDNAEQLITDLGEGYHYGEWWGKGIQRNYELDEKRFSLFNPNKQSTVCHNVPYFGMSGFLTVNENIKYFLNRLETNGSIASPGFMKPEGIVIYAEKAKCSWKAFCESE